MDKEERRRLRTGSHSHTERRRPLQEHITTVDIALSILSEKERYIIELKYPSECNIPEIVQRFADRYRYGSYNGIKKIIDESKNKMNNLLQKKSA